MTTSLRSVRSVGSAGDSLSGGLDAENLNAGQLVNAGIDDLSTDESTVVLLVVDATGSMAGMRDATIDDVREMLEAWKESKAADDIVVGLWTFNTTPTKVHGYQLLANAPGLSPATYDPSGFTALYDAMYESLTDMEQYVSDLRSRGQQVKAVVAFFTDGEDNESQRSPAQVREVVERLQNQERYHISITSFGQGIAKQVAADTGIRNVLNAGADRSSRRRATGQVSASVIRVSQGQVSAGGFFS